MELSNRITSPKLAEPQAPDWANVSLAETWPDALNLSNWRGWRELMRAFFGKQRRVVELPDSAGSLYPVPKYILQEFHNLPNGNYSRRITRGYIAGFDFVMLGHMQRARAWVASQLQGCQSVLDVGTAGGRTAALIKQQGTAQVWGIDPSPYLLQHAASDYPDITFVPGVAENLPFTDQRLEGISLCFVFHEMPPKYIKQALAEFYRVLQDGGKIVIAEPSPRQLEPLQWRFLLSRAGWSQIYFKLLAHRVYEPFLDAWHKLDKPKTLQEAGFYLLEDRPGMPINFWVAEKRAQ